MATLTAEELSHFAGEPPRAEMLYTAFGSKAKFVIDHIDEWAKRAVHQYAAGLITSTRTVELVERNVGARALGANMTLISIRYIYRAFVGGIGYQSWMVKFGLYETAAGIDADTPVDKAEFYAWDEVKRAWHFAFSMDVGVSDPQEWKYERSADDGMSFPDPA